MEEKERSNAGLIVAFIIVIAVILALSALIGLMLFGDEIGIHILPTQETTAPTTEPVTTVAATTAEPTTEPMWEVPDIEGMKANDAYAALHRAGTRFEIKREYSAEVAPEYVISQSPEAGTMIPDSDKVLVIISKGVDQPDTTPPATTAPATTKPGRQQSSEASGDYILSGSDKRYISFSEVTPLNERQLTLALNEIYARNGRKFNSPELQAYFNSKSWYKGTIAPSDFDEDSLNEYESANVKTILAVMTERGYR